MRGAGRVVLPRRAGADSLEDQELFVSLAAGVEEVAVESFFDPLSLVEFSPFEASDLPPLLDEAGELVLLFA